MSNIIKNEYTRVTTMHGDIPVRESVGYIMNEIAVESGNFIKLTNHNTGKPQYFNVSYIIAVREG